MADPGFQYAQFADAFPQLVSPLPPNTTPSLAYLEILYTYATLIPEGNRIINDVSLTSAQQINMLNLLLAHILFLAQRDASAVGQLQTATEGSVTAAFNYPVKGTTEAWYGQSQYGAMFFRMMAPYRSMQYAIGPGARRCLPGIFLGPNVYPGNGGWGNGYGPWGGW